MSKTVLKLWSIRSKNDFGKAQTYSRMNVLSTVTICEKFTTEVFSSFNTPLSITNQLFREHQVGIAEGRHRALREFRRTHHPFPQSREPPHNSNHEASQARYRSCCHRKYLKQHFAYFKSMANKSFCQMRESQSNCDIA